MVWQQRLQCGILNGALSTKMASTPPSPQLWSLLNRIRRISYKTGRGQLDGSETPDQHVRSFQSFTTFLFEIKLTKSLILYFLIQASWHINVLTLATCSSLLFLWFLPEQVQCHNDKVDNIFAKDLPTIPNLSRQLKLKTFSRKKAQGRTANSGFSFFNFPNEAPTRRPRRVPPEPPR